MSNTRKFFDNATWVVFFGSIIFSLLTVVAQNTLPGDLLYGFKLGYEKAMLASSRFINKGIDLQIEYVGRRFNETTKVLASKEGKESLSRLNTEVESTAYSITMMEDPEEKQQAAEKYITQLNAISSGLGEQKQNFINNTVPNTGTLSDSQTNSISNTTATDNYQPAATSFGSSQIVTEIDNTQSTIEQTIQQMENITQDTSSTNPSPTSIPQPTSAPTSAPIATPTTAPRSQTVKDRAKEWCENNPVACERAKQRRQEDD